MIIIDILNSYPMVTRRARRTIKGVIMFIEQNTMFVNLFFEKRVSPYCLRYVRSLRASYNSLYNVI